MRVRVRARATNDRFSIAIYLRQYFTINIRKEIAILLQLDIRERVNWKREIDCAKIITSKKSMRASGAEASQYEITGQLGLVPDARLHGP